MQTLLPLILLQCMLTGILLLLCWNLNVPLNEAYFGGIPKQQLVK